MPAAVRPDRQSERRERGMRPRERRLLFPGEEAIGRATTAISRAIPLLAGDAASGLPAHREIELEVEG